MSKIGRGGLNQIGPSMRVSRMARWGHQIHRPKKKFLSPEDCRRIEKHYEKKKLRSNMELDNKRHSRYRAAPSLPKLKFMEGEGDD